MKRMARCSDAAWNSFAVDGSPNSLATRAIVSVGLAAGDQGRLRNLNDTLTLAR